MLSAAHQCEPQRRSTEQCQDYQCAAAPLQICLTDGGHHLSRNALYLINYTTCTRAALALDESTIWAFFAQYGRLIGE